MLKLILNHYSKIGICMSFAGFLWEYPRVMLFQFLLAMANDSIRRNTQRNSSVFFMFQVAALLCVWAVLIHDVVYHEPSLWKYVIVSPLTLYGGLLRIIGVPVYSLVVAVWEAVVTLQQVDLQHQPQIPYDLRSRHQQRLFVAARPSQELRNYIAYMRFSGEIVLALFFCVVFAVATFCQSPGRDGENLRDAARNCDVDSARKALSRGTNPNSKGQYDKATALHICGQQALPEMARILVEHGADPNVRDGLGFTPLHWAVQLRREETCVEKRLETIRVLLESGGNPRLKDPKGHSPLSIAQRKENTRALEVIASVLGDESTVNQHQTSVIHSTSTRTTAEMIPT